MERPAIENALDQLCINTIRTLSMDAVQAADSGHRVQQLRLDARRQANIPFGPGNVAILNNDEFVVADV